LLIFLYTTASGSKWQTFCNQPASCPFHYPTNAVTKTVEQVSVINKMLPVEGHRNSDCIVGIVQLLDPVKEMLQTELTRKLTSTDAALKDSVAKLVRSKVTVESHSIAFLSS